MPPKPESSSFPHGPGVEILFHRESFQPHHRSIPKEITVIEAIVCDEKTFTSCRSWDAWKVAENLVMEHEVALLSWDGYRELLEGKP